MALHDTHYEVILWYKLHASIALGCDVSSNTILKMITQQTEERKEKIQWWYCRLHYRK